MKRLITYFVLSLAWILTTRTDLSAGQLSNSSDRMNYENFRFDKTGSKEGKFHQNKPKTRNHTRNRKDLWLHSKAVKRPYSGNKSGSNDTILANYDFYTIPEASFLIGGAELPELPADFFGAGSDPFSGTIYFAGENSYGNIVPYPDFEVDRMENAYFSTPYPSTDNVEISVYDMSVISTAPITVTYNNGQYSEQWNVEMYYYTKETKAGDSVSITKTDETGGYFSYGPIRIQPYFYFWNDNEGIDWDTGDSIPPIVYYSVNDLDWSHSPIGQDFNPSDDDTLHMNSTAGESFFDLFPLMLRYEDFTVYADDAGNVSGSGSGFNNGEWYYYPGLNLWITWFYDHQLDMDRVKEYYIDLSVSSTGTPSNAEFYLGWATPEWTNFGGVPDEPPLPQYLPNPQEEETNIALFDSFLSGEIDGTVYPYIDYQIAEYNPQWVCIAVRGENFGAEYGYSEHICFDPGWDNDAFDWGDAPDPAYPTLAVNNGARNRIFIQEWDDPLALGDDVDGEPDGQPDAVALGDDYNGLDDEDGLIEISELVQGSEASMTVSSNRTGGYFNAWLDFNADGDWDDENEHIFINEQIWDSPVVLSFDVPFEAVPGQTMLRLRYSSFAGSGYSGPALDGEVEDYAVNLEAFGNKLEQLPDSTLAGYEAHDYNSGGVYSVLYVADDWECEGGWVNKIEWWGYYPMYQGVELRGSGIDHFNVRILYHYPEDCTPANWELYTMDIPFDSVYETATGWTNNLNNNVYHYECNLAEPFIQHQGEKYWLAISAISNNPDDPVLWSWQESANLQEPSFCGGRYKEWPNGQWDEIVRGEWPVLYPDYAFVIHSMAPQPADFGDAPDNEDDDYQVILSDYGAVHIIDNAVYLGSTVDAEPDGQPDNNALGDDNSGTDDEDGVVFLTPLIAGNIATIQVTASVNGYLNAWADFAHYQSWEDQQLLDDYLLNQGVNVISFPVPFNAVAGNTYFRFRFSTVPGLEDYGQAPDGEVEDYMAEVTIEDNKWLQPPSENLSGKPAHDYYVYDNGPVYTYNQLADDWICMGGNVITVKWWGSYDIDENTGQEIRGSGINYWHLGINLNNDQYNEPSSSEEWSADVPFSQIQEINTGFVNSSGAAIYEYSYDLPVPFAQIAGNHYWFTIVAFCNDAADPAHWNWQLSSCGDIRLNPAMFFYYDDPSWYLLFYNNAYVDLAFEIFSDSYTGLDYGDAPDIYATLFEDDGAAHVIDTTLYLGDKIDAEADGQPGTFALGDDQNGIDDEDGITFPSLYRGANVTFTVKASAQGYLNAWIDFDGNGSWEEGDEHIFVDEPLDAGFNYISGYIPEGADAGYTFARFRFSTATGLEPTGIATDGEVEDYRVYIESEPPFKWEQPPETEFYALQVNAAPGYLLADDFVCDKTGPLTGISIYGSWLNNDPPAGGVGDAVFTLAIHDAIPNGEGTMPGNVLWTHTYQPGEFEYQFIIYEQNFDWQNPDGSGYLVSPNMACIRYDFEIPEGDFKQEGTPYLPKKYWLTLQVSSGTNYLFGWNSTYHDEKIGVTSSGNGMWTTGTEPYNGIWDSVFYANGHPYEGDPVGFAFDIKGLEDPYLLIDLQVVPEFASNEYKGKGNPDFSETVIPLHQPFDGNPGARWYYDGDEQVEYIPYAGFTLDWILVELRDAESAADATDATVIGRVPAFVDMDGDVFSINNESYLKIYCNPVNIPYIAVWQRNHLGILSSGPVYWNGVEYEYDFTTGPESAYGGTEALKNFGQSTFGWDIWGMYGGDANGDGVVDIQNDLQTWNLQSGEHGYLEADVNLDSEVNNKDKDDVIIENQGKSCLIPQ